MRRSRGWLLEAALIALLVVGCTPLPRAELTAYSGAYSDIQTITNGVLDIIVPYERIVIRNAAMDTISVVTSPGNARAQTVPDAALLADHSAAGPVRGPPPDPSLLADPSAASSARQRPPPDPALLANPSAVSSSPQRPPPDPALLANPSAVSSSPQRPPPDPTLLTDPSAVSSARQRPPPDPSLLADPNAVSSVRQRPPPDPSLLAVPNAGERQSNRLLLIQPHSLGRWLPELLPGPLGRALPLEAAAGP
jgi:hypothetical protein